MTWLNVNPKGECARRISAALALTATPTTQEQLLGKFFEREISSVELAQLYNNAESLGLDLFSLGQVSPDVEENE